MPDMYGRGLATGQLVGGLIDPAPTRIAGNSRKWALEKLSMNGAGIEYQNGAWVPTEKAAALYKDSPEFLAVALQQAPIVARKAHEEQLKIDSDEFNLGLKAAQELDKVVKDIRDNENIPPQLKTTMAKNALERLGSIYEKVSDGRIWNKYQFPKYIASISSDLGVKEAHNQVAVSLLGEIQQKIRDNPDETTPEMMHDYELFRGSLPKDMKDMFLNTKDAFKEAYPKKFFNLDTQRKTQAGVDKQKALAPLRLAEEEKKAGIQASKELKVAEKKQDMLAKYDTKMALVLRAMNIDPEAVRSGKRVLTPQEAETALDKLGKASGLAEIIRAFNAGNEGGAKNKNIDYDSDGNKVNE